MSSYLHYCSICNKKEKCKGEDCDYMNLLGVHSSCMVKKELKKSKPKKKKEKILHECSDCGQIHILKNKWWEK